MTSTYFIPVKKLFIILLMCWMVVPYALGEGADKTKARAMQLYEASGRYYEKQLYDSAVIVDEQALPMLRQLGMTDEVADELSILAVCTS